MNILLVGNFLSTVNGTYSVEEDLSQHLAASGHSIQVTSHKIGRLARLIDMATTIWRERNNHAVAQVNVYSGLAFLWAEVSCGLLQRVGKPYILTLHGGNLPAFSRRWPGRVRRLLKSAAEVTTPSRFLLEQMRSYRSDLILLPNPLDINRYPYEPRKEVQPRLVWLRSFHLIYNPSLAPKVLALLAKDFPNVSLMMIGRDKGDGSLEEVQQIATELKVSALIQFPGGVPKNQVPLWLNQSDIFLNTTNLDNTPISVMEAMACGLCIVSTNVGGILYLLEDERDALLVAPDDPQAMAAAVRRILTEPGLAERLSHNARCKVEQFDWSVILPQWEQLMLSVAEGRQNGAF